MKISVFGYFASIVFMYRMYVLLITANAVETYAKLDVLINIFT